MRSHPGSCSARSSLPVLLTRQTALLPYGHQKPVRLPCPGKARQPRRHHGTMRLYVPLNPALLPPVHRPQQLAPAPARQGWCSARGPLPAAAPRRRRRRCWTAQQSPLAGHGAEQQGPPRADPPCWACWAARGRAAARQGAALPARRPLGAPGRAGSWPAGGRAGAGAGSARVGDQWTRAMHI